MEQIEKDYIITLINKEIEDARIMKQGDIKIKALKRLKSNFLNCCEQLENLQFFKKKCGKIKTTNTPEELTEAFEKHIQNIE